jgi:hypothetical protein
LACPFINTIPFVRNLKINIKREMADFKIKFTKYSNLNQT